MTDDREEHFGFVEEMLKKSEKKDETPSQSRSDADPKEVEKLMKEIQEKIQQG